MASAEPHMFHGRKMTRFNSQLTHNEKGEQLYRIQLETEDKCCCNDIEMLILKYRDEEISKKTTSYNAQFMQDEKGKWVHYIQLETKNAWCYTVVKRMIRIFMYKEKLEIKKKRESKMEDYKLRMVKEYKELKDKYDKLRAMLVKYDAGKLDFTPTCQIDLLRKQASVMDQYLYILETRAVIENVDFDAKDSRG